jgi:hypothetical protein
LVLSVFSSLFFFLFCHLFLVELFFVELFHKKHRTSLQNTSTSKKFSSFGAFLVLMQHQKKHQRSTKRGKNDRNQSLFFIWKMQRKKTTQKFVCTETKRFCEGKKKQKKVQEKRITLALS